MSEDRFLQDSPYAADNGEKVGRVPREISLGDLRALGHPESAAKAIRAKCVDCAGGSETEVRKCVAYDCPLWPYRMGRNPFISKRREQAA